MANHIGSYPNSLPNVKKFNSVLKKIYYNPEEEGSLGGLRRLYVRARTELGGPESAAASGLSLNYVRKWLRGQQGYTLHRPARRKFERRKIICHGIDDQWQADLADFSQISEHNNGFKWMLVVYDTFSKFAWAEPVRTKSGKDVAQAFENIFRASKARLPNRLQTDEGTEFYNLHVQTLLNSKRIAHFSSASDQKAAGAERLNGTLKSKIYHYFTAQQTYNWVQVLPQILKSYNSSIHSVTGLRPSEVEPKHESKLWQKMYMDQVTTPNVKTSKKDDIPIGTSVRISRVKGKFEKGYDANWSESHYIVYNKAAKSGNKIVYFLKEYDSERIKGAFYREEIQPITRNRYRIKILKERNFRGGHKRYLVHYIGWADKYDAWLKEDAIKNTKPHGEKLVD